MASRQVSTTSNMTVGFINPDRDLASRRGGLTIIWLSGEQQVFDQPSCFTSWIGCTNQIFATIYRHSIPTHSSLSQKGITPSFRFGYLGRIVLRPPVNLYLRLSIPRVTVMWNFLTRCLRIPPFSYSYRKRRQPFGCANWIGSLSMVAWPWS